MCTSPEDPDLTLICDRCESAFHTYCVTPPLSTVPEGSWYCPKCMMHLTKKRVEPIPKKQKIPKPPKAPKPPKVPKTKKVSSTKTSSGSVKSSSTPSTFEQLPFSFPNNSIPISTTFNSSLAKPQTQFFNTTILSKRKIESITEETETEEENEEEEVYEVDGFEILCSPHQKEHK